MDGFYGQDSTKGPSPIPHSWSLLVIWPLTSHGVSHWEGIPFQGIHRKKKSADSMDSTGADGRQSTTDCDNTLTLLLLVTLCRRTHLKRY